MLKRFRNIILGLCYLYLVFLLFTGCAQVVAPNGGPKDLTAPKALEYSPENKSTHFATNKISIKFNEYIQLKDLTNQLVVSPPLKRFPIAIIKKGKILSVQLKDTLQDNTTYTFNFGNAIADINEGNILPNFQYVVSTGNYIDSIKLSGRAEDAFTRDAQKDALVMIYANQDDSAPYKTLPSYCGHTDKNGIYHIENIKNGIYKLVILSKSQNGYFYHPYTETIGFSGKPVNLEKNDTVNLSLFMEQETRFHFIKARAVDKGKILLVFSAPADSISVKPLNITGNPYTLLQPLGASHDSVYYWINTPGLDSLHFIISKNGKNVDTPSVYSIPGAKTITKKGAKPPSLRVSTNIQGDYDYHYPITLRADHPVIKYDLSKIYLTKSKDTLKYKTDTAGMPFQLALSSGLTSDSSYRLFLAPGALTDIFGFVNDTLITRFKVLEQTYFGTLQLNLSFTNKDQYIIQLLDDQGRMVKENIIKDAKKIYYDALPPGNYRVRAIDDENHDGKWTTGDYMKHRQPEKVYYYFQTLTIRSNWDLTQDWKVE